mmetsp:Transcript_9532/g.24313  ORF Transcript_9532/g.24313 Transcript_9532/m.24313 type:complete len:209 (+) Transcript_9532:1090-1716(+)
MLGILASQAQAHPTKLGAPCRSCVHPAHNTIKCIHFPTGCKPLTGQTSGASDGLLPIGAWGLLMSTGTYNLLPSLPRSRLTSCSSSASVMTVLLLTGCRASWCTTTGCWLRSRFSMSRSTMTMPSMRISWLFTLRCRRSTCLSTAGSCDSESLTRCAVSSMKSIWSSMLRNACSGSLSSPGSRPCLLSVLGGMAPLPSPPSSPPSSPS